MTNEGERVGAIFYTDEEDKKLYMAGYGVYVGKIIPPPGVVIMGIDLHEANMSNPKIELDSGGVVWGCQCWWGPEELVINRVNTHKAEGFEIVMVTPEEYLKCDL